MTEASGRRLVENEAVFRQANELVVHGIAELDALAQEDGQLEHAAGPKFMEQVLHFFCECSDAGCTGRVKMTLKQYEEIHEVRNRFVVLPGHEVSAIEKVVARHKPDYNVVEKLHLVPDLDVS